MNRLCLLAALFFLLLLVQPAFAEDDCTNNSSNNFDIYNYLKSKFDVKETDYNIKQYYCPALDCEKNNNTTCATQNYVEALYQYIEKYKRLQNARVFTYFLVFVLFFVFFLYKFRKEKNRQLFYFTPSFVLFLLWILYLILGVYEAHYRLYGLIVVFMALILIFICIKSKKDIDDFWNNPENTKTFLTIVATLFIGFAIFSTHYLDISGKMIDIEKEPILPVKIVRYNDIFSNEMNLYSLFLFGTIISGAITVLVTFLWLLKKKKDDYVQAALYASAFVFLMMLTNVILKLTGII